jgi:molybdopterin-binding protein
VATTPITLAGHDLRRSYRGRLVLDVPFLEVSAGKTMVLLGPSGAGKTTLLTILGLLERPDTGHVTIDGREVTARDRAARLQMAAVFQRPFLFRGSVGENVAYGMKLRRMSGARVREAVRSTLERVGLSGFEDHSALTLSGGEAQRVALARALVLEPRVLLLDEPLGSLDVVMKDRLSREFAEILREQSVTTLYVTHDQDEALVVADDITIMNEGRIISSGAADSVMGLPGDDWAAAFLGMEPPLSGVVIANELGVAKVDAGGAEVYAVSDAAAGTEVLLGIRPEDVLLFEPDVELPRTSARNRLDGTVAYVSSQGATVRVVVVSRGARFASSVSRSSASSLGLKVGAKVTAVFKATAVRVQPRDTIAGLVDGARNPDGTTPDRGHG